jgi:hypothetical protein
MIFSVVSCDYVEKEGLSAVIPDETIDRHTTVEQLYLMGVPRVDEVTAGFAGKDAERPYLLEV